MPARNGVPDGLGRGVWTCTGRYSANRLLLPHQHRHWKTRRSMAELLLGLDIGTSSSKGILATAEGQVVAHMERPHGVSRPQPGWVEHDPVSVWWTDAAAILRDLTADADGQIVGVGVSGIGPCLLPTDEGDRPLRPAILYGVDTRASAEIEELTARFGADRILSRGGSALTSQAVGPKLLWLRRHEPEVWQRTRRFYMASSYLVQRLTGSYVLDHHSASQCDPLYDMTAGGWAFDWANEVAPHLELPTLLWPAEVAGRVTAEASAATGLPTGIPVIAGTIDAWAEAASVGIRQPGDTMLMYGTTMFIIEVVDQLRPDPTIWSTAGITPGSRTLAAGMATSGALTGWFRDLVGSPSFDTLVHEASDAPAGSRGLLVLPYFAGERTPIFDPDARGFIAGLTMEHTRGDIYRAFLESTGYGVRHILAALERAGSQPSRLVAVGGGTRGGLWTRVVSSITGRPQEIPKITVGAAYGDAYMAGLGSGVIDPTADWTRFSETVVPDPSARAVYDALYDDYLALYPATRDIAHRLASHQRGGRGR